ncbi:hypothetical protein BDV95DRAFT_595011 [Massariosphaeria phaeospora]|uniref:Aspartic peptidase domain-containing protein n=1 Tax=Massariosphaeria phaeospora TaxID=100035 RepID=A0A7C8M9K6_9PLEO|nr:hypothetical protein BDV95DRAFT_595011 [Massariosphaeria phaeospora]
MASSWPSLCSFRSLALASLAIASRASAQSQCNVQPLSLTWSNITVTQDGLGVTRGIELGVGSPHQVFSFRPSTTLNNTRINNVLNCGSAGNNSCIGGLGGGFEQSKSRTYSLSIKSQWNGSAIDQEDSTGAFVYFNDDVGFQSQGDVDGFPLVMESEVGGGSQSGLPLGTNSSFLRAAVAGGVAPSQVFGLWSGSRGVNPRDGMLIIGGYDRARIKSGADSTTFPVGQWSLERACPLQVTITNLTYAGLPLINPERKPIIACIEPSAQRFTFPPTIATNFALLTGQNSTTYPKGMHYNTANRPTGDLQITLSNGYQSTIPNDELFAPLRGSDQNGRYAITNDSIVEAFIRDNRDKDPGDVNHEIGAMFLTFNYLTVDYAKNEFSLAPAKTKSLSEIPPDPVMVCTPDPSGPAPPPPPPSSSSTNVGAIAGGVVGGVGGLALIAGLAFALLRRNRNAKKGLSVSSTSFEPDAIHPAVHRHPSEMEDTQIPVVYEMPASRQASVRKSARAELRDGNVYT